MNSRATKEGRRFGKNVALWDAELDRGLLDFLDANKGPEGIFMTNVTFAKEEAAEHLRNKFPSKDPKVEKAKQVESRLDKFTRRYALEKNISTSQLYSIGSMALDYRKLRPETYTESEMRTWKAHYEANKAIMKSQQKPKRKEVENSESEEDGDHSSSKRRKANINDDEPPISTVNQAADLQRLHDLRHGGELKSTTNKKHIQEGITDLHESILMTVRDYLEESGIEMDEPIQLDFEPRGHDLRELIDMVAGSDKETPGDYQSRLSGMQAQQRLGIGAFVRALVMAAVTRWTLLSLPQGDQSGGLYEGAWNYMRACE